MAKSPLLPGETTGEYLNRISGSGTIIAASRDVRRRQRRKPRSRSSGFQHQPKAAPAEEVEKPDFDTAVRAKHGDKRAQRQVNLWIKSQQVKKRQEEMVQALEDRALFGQAEGAIKSAAKTVDPRAAAVITALSPSTAIKEAARGFQHGDIGPAAINILGILPMGRGATSAARAARVLRAEQRAARAEATAVARLEKAGFKHAPRTLTVGEKTQDLPPARSRVTRYGIEKPADIVSSKLPRRTPLASAEARVAKHAGRETRRESERALAAKTADLRALPKENSPEDLAHFWWAQLPSDLRNVEGLRRIRALQAKELDEIVSGTRLKELLARKQTKKVALQIEDLQPLADDLSLSIARLNEVIANPPKLNPRVLEAVRSLSGTRRQLLEDVRLLDPEKAAAREGLVARAVGAVPAGDEAFIGHRLGKVRGSQPHLVPASVGTGKPLRPQGLQKNKSILMRQGRVRQSTHVAAQDWQASETYRTALKTRDDLWKMGEEFPGHLPKGYRIINPKGRAVPAAWKTDRLAQLAADGANEEELARAAEEVMGGFLGKAGMSQDDLDAFIKAAKAQGADLEDLRILPEKTVQRYFDQFTPYRTSSKSLKVYDAAIDAVMTNLIFLRIGYIPKNVVQNLIMAVPHQGVFFLANLPRAAQILADPQLRHLLSVEVGQGATGAVAAEAATRALRAPAHVVTGVADTPLRISAIVHELAAAGVLPKFNPRLTEVDRASIMEFYGNPAHRSLANAVSARATDAMADFGRMTPKQRRLARRFLIIPGWLMAGSRYPFHFAATHPGRSAAMAYVAAGEPGAPEEYQVNKPIDEYFADWTPSWLEGIPTPWGFERTGSINPVSTAPQMARALAAQSPETAIDYANPVPMAVIDTLRRQVETPEGGSRRVGYGEAAERNLLERLAPNYSLARDLISPPDGENRIYPDTSRLGRLKRETGILPVEVNKQAALRSKLVESGSDAQKAAFNLKADYRAAIKDLERLGVKLAPDEKRDIRRAYALSTALAKAAASKDETSDKIRAALELDRKYRLLSPQDRRDVQAFLRTSTEAMNESLWRKIQGIYGGDVRARVSEAINSSLAEKRLDPTEVRGIR